MKKFLIFKPETGFFISTYRNPKGYTNECLEGFIEDVVEGKNSTFEGDFPAACQLLRLHSFTLNILVKHSNLDGDCKIADVLMEMYETMLTSQNQIPESLGIKGEIND